MKNPLLFTLNGLTIVTGLPAIVQGATMAKRLWALAEVAGAAGDIVINTEYVQKNYPRLATATNVFNGAMGVVGLKNLITNSGIRSFATNLPSQVKQAFKDSKEIKSIIAAEYLKWKIAVTEIKNISLAEQELITKQEKIWKAFGVLDKIESLIFKGVKYENFIQTFTATEEQYKKAYQLWGEGKWNELFDYFKTENLNNWNGINWPPFSGFARINKTISAKNYEFRIDRFQKESEFRRRIWKSYFEKF